VIIYIFGSEKTVIVEKSETHIRVVISDKH
jgi:hypothetical protein